MTPDQFKVNSTFRFLNFRAYPPNEIFTVIAIDANGIDCHTSRFPGVTHRFPAAALGMYEGVIELLEPLTAPDVRHAMRMADEALANMPIGEAVRFEEVLEQGKLAA